MENSVKIENLEIAAVAIPGKWGSLENSISEDAEMPEFAEKESFNVYDFDKTILPYDSTPPSSFSA